MRIRKRWPLSADVVSSVSDAVVADWRVCALKANCWAPHRQLFRSVESVLLSACRHVPDIKTFHACVHRIRVSLEMKELDSSPTVCGANSGEAVLFLVGRRGISLPCDTMRMTGQKKLDVVPRSTQSC